MYMSYCRFEGTLNELRACLAEVQEHVDGAAEYEVSNREIDCFQNMVETFFDFMQENGLIDWDVELDKDALSQVCNEMAKGSEEEE